MLMFPSEKVGSITGLPQPLNTPKIMAVTTSDTTSNAITIADNTCSIAGGNVYATKGFTSFISSASTKYYILHDDGTITSHNANSNVSQSLPSDYNVVVINPTTASRVTITFS